MAKMEYKVEKVIGQITDVLNPDFNDFHRDCEELLDLLVNEEKWSLAATASDIFPVVQFGQTTHLLAVNTYTFTKVNFTNQNKDKSVPFNVG